MDAIKPFNFAKSNDEDRKCSLCIHVWDESTITACTVNEWRTVSHDNVCDKFKGD